jgi:spoIIIJ-associated protein
MPSPSLSPRETLEMILGHLGFVFEVQEARQDETVTLNILTRDPGRLIGRDGHTLEDLQYLINRLLHHQEDAPARVIIDVEGYRQKEQLDFLAEVRDIADRVKRSGKAEKLRPMNSFDRRLVHQALQDDTQIRTRSEDTGGRLKQIVIEPRSA